MTVAAIVVCEMIEEETSLALERALPKGQRPPLIWIESALHERPASLKLRLAELVHRLDEGARAGVSVEVPGVRPGDGPAEDRLEAVEVGPSGDIVLGFGYCGGGLEGLVSQERRLILLRAHDCVDVLLRECRDAKSYYLTNGWFCHSSSLSGNLDDWPRLYGQEEMKRLWALMFAGYDHLSLIDTGAFAVDECLPHSMARAEMWGLRHRIVPGSVGALERLFAGTGGDDEMIVLDPGQPMRIDHVLLA